MVVNCDANIAMADIIKNLLSLASMVICVCGVSYSFVGCLGSSRMGSSALEEDIP